METKKLFKKQKNGEVKESPGETASSKEEKEELYQKVKTLPALLNWKSPARPFQKKSKQYFSTAGIIALVFILVSVLLQWWMAIGVVLTLLFLAYVLGTVEPEVIDHKITGKGIVSHNKVFLWEDLKGFWFDKSEGQNLLVLEAKKGFPSRIVILLGLTTTQAVSNILARYLSEKKAPPTDFLDKLAKKMSAWIPLET